MLVGPFFACVLVRLFSSLCLHSAVHSSPSVWSDLEVHHTIAELMILANVEVALAIQRAFPTQVSGGWPTACSRMHCRSVFVEFVWFCASKQALLRRHLAAPRERFDELLAIAHLAVSAAL